MKKNFILNTVLILILIGSNVCFSKEKRYTNELEFGDPAAKKVLQIGGNGDLNITGYKGDKILISADVDIFKEGDEVNEKAKGLKKIGGGGFNVINNKNENVIFVTRPFDKGIDLDIKVPNDITLKLGNGGVVKNQELKKQQKKLREEKRQLEKKTQNAKKMQYNYQYDYRFTMPSTPFMNKFGVSTGIFEGVISIKDFAGIIEINSVNGSINAENIKGEVAVSTVNGDINVSFITINKDRALYFSTVNGDIDITLPGDTRADIIARTMEGDVYSGFEGEISLGKDVEGKKTKNGYQYSYTPYLNSNYITTRINGGGQNVHLNTIDGNIYIRKGK